jgi:hypothetical protein
MISRQLLDSSREVRTAARELGAKLAPGGTTYRQLRDACADTLECTVPPELARLAHKL